MTKKRNIIEIFSFFIPRTPGCIFKRALPFINPNITPRTQIVFGAGCTPKPSLWPWVTELLLAEGGGSSRESCKSCQQLPAPLLCTLRFTSASGEQFQPGINSQRFYFIEVRAPTAGNLDFTEFLNKWCFPCQSDATWSAGETTEKSLIL